MTERIPQPPRVLDFASTGEGTALVNIDPEATIHDVVMTWRHISEIKDTDEGIITGFLHQVFETTTILEDIALPLPAELARSYNTDYLSDHAETRQCLVLNEGARLDDLRNGLMHLYGRERFDEGVYWFVDQIFSRKIMTGHLLLIPVNNSFIDSSDAALEAGLNSILGTDSDPDQ